MSEMRYIMMALITVSFAMLTACNDGFKSNALTAGKNYPQLDRDEGNLLPGNTSEDEDANALAALNAILDNQDYSSSTDLGLDVAAFSIVRSDRFDEDGITFMQMTTVVRTGCDSDEKLEVTSAVNADRFMRKEPTLIGTSGNYEFYAQCSDEVCDDIIGTIYRKNSNGEFGRLDVGMTGEYTRTTFSSRVIEYAARSTQGRGLVTRPSVFAYEKNCVDELDSLFYDYDAGGPQ